MTQFATARIGAILVTLNPAYPESFGAGRPDAGRRTQGDPVSNAQRGSTKTLVR